MNGYRFRPVGRTIEGEDEMARVRRIHDEMRLRREYLKAHKQASDDPSATKGDIKANVFGLKDIVKVCVTEDDWEVVAQSAGRIERAARSLLAAERRDRLLELMKEAGILEPKG